MQYSKILALSLALLTFNSCLSQENISSGIIKTQSQKEVNQTKKNNSGKDIKVKISGSKDIYLGKRICLKLEVSNLGKTNLKDVIINSYVGSRSKIISSRHGNIDINNIEWKISSLKASETKISEIIILPVSRGINFVKVHLFDSKKVQAKWSVCLACIKAEIDILTNKKTILSKENVAITVEINNWDYSSLPNTKVKCIFPPELMPIQSIENKYLSIDGETVNFVNEFPNRKIKFSIYAKALSVGDARIKFYVYFNGKLFRNREKLVYID